MTKKYYRVAFTRSWHGCGYNTDYSIDIDIHPLEFEKKNSEIISVNSWNEYTEKEFHPDIEYSRKWLQAEVAAIL